MRLYSIQCSLVVDFRLFIYLVLGKIKKAFFNCFYIRKRILRGFHIIDNVNGFWLFESLKIVRLIHQNITKSFLH